MFIVIDIGGTNTRVAGSKNLKTAFRKREFPTPKNFLLGLMKISETIENLSQNKKIKAIALGLPGVIDRKTGQLLKAPNLKNWVKQPIKNLISQEFRCPVFIANDVELSGLGEAAFGAGRKYRLIAYVAIGTGLGGIKIIDKEIDKSTQGFEPGHQIIKLNGPFWPPCGQNGCLESYVGGRAFAQKYKIKPENCSNPKIWTDWSQKLGQGLINIIVLWSPQIIIIGGGFTKKSGLFLKPLKKFINRNLLIFKTPLIVKGALGDRAGVYGGFYLIKKVFK